MIHTLALILSIVLKALSTVFRIDSSALNRGSNDLELVALERIMSSANVANDALDSV